MILILDYGSQYTQLIARRVRESKVYCEIVAYDHKNLLEFKERNVEGIILSGGPESVYAEESPFLPKEVKEWKVPVLGICYGAQLFVHEYGGKVESSTEREFGQADVVFQSDSSFSKNIENNLPHSAWMSHGDKIVSLPDGFDVVATSKGSPYAAFENKSLSFHAVQFHPEVTHTSFGKQLLQNFLFEICKAKADWTMHNFVEYEIAKIQKQVENQHVICGISGGVDSSVMTVLLHKALGDQVTAIFVDHGLLRKNERVDVESSIRKAFGVKLKVVDAKDEFFLALKGVTDPEKKRKIIGNKFIEVFEREAKKISNATFLGQGTIYPDVIESASHRGPAVTIKSHHNVGGLPEHMNLKLIEPLRELFKDEIRELGKELGIEKHFLDRHPFPGPGMAVRVLGEVTKERVKTLQEADFIFIEELHNHNLYNEVWQAFAVLLPVQSVGVMGDFRTYENVCALRAVGSVDGMTATWSELPHKFLGFVSNRIINEVKGINRVVYDISSKPPATIEWE